MQRSRLAVLVGGAVIAITMLIPGSGRVLAHAGLESSLPAASSTLDVPPDRIVLDLDEAIEISTASIELFDSAGVAVVLGDPKAVPGDDTIVQAELPAIDDGTFAVVWRVASLDGHVVDGAFSFRVGLSGGVDGNALVEQVSQGVQSPSIVRQLYGVARLLTYLGLAIVIGGGWLALVSDRLAERRTQRLMRVATVAALAGGLATVGLYGATTVAGGVGDAFSSDVLGQVGDTHTGRVLLVRLGLLLALAGLAASMRLAATMAWRVSMLVVGIAVVITFPLAGHASATSPTFVWVPIGALHIAAVFVWLGGLVMLSVAGGTWTKPEPEPDSGPKPSGPQPIRRFSNVAAVCVPVIVATGIAETLRLAGGLDDLTATSWGRVLLIKVSLVVVMVALGGVSRQVLHRGMVAPLRRTVAAEALLGVAVLGLAAGLVGLSPEPAAKADVFQATLTQAGLVADITLTPGGAGANEVHIVLAPPGGNLQPVVSVIGRMSLPERGIQDSPITIDTNGVNHYIGRITLPYPGTWALQLVVEVGAGTTLLLDTTVDIP